MTELTHEEFSKHLNTTFRIRLNNERTIDAKLIEVSERLVSPRQERFSLVFLSSNEVLIQQGMAPFEHDQMGSFQLFIVPIGQDEEGISYEAVFNRLAKKS
ncbi:MAG: DUF6916 family protein [Pyrinomonadaceae bacterium]